MSRPAARVLPMVAALAVPLVLMSACGTSGTSGGPTSSPAPTGAGEPTVTVTATATQSATGGPTPGPTASGSASSSASARPALCATGSLTIRYADDRGGAGAGSVAGTLTFTNKGSASCTLRGFPGVSYVTGDAGTQVGQAASRTDDAVRTKTLAPGRSVTAGLRRGQPGSYGDDCQQTAVRGLRVYPPGSKEAAFVAFRTTGCKSTAAPLLEVGPVR